MYEINFFLRIAPLFSCGRVSFLALSTAGHSGGPRVLAAQVWAPANGNLTIQYFYFSSAAAAAVSCLYHTVPQALKLSTCLVATTAQ